MSDIASAHPLWLGLQPLALASNSRTRFDLLIAAGIPVEVIKPHVDERAIAAPLEAAFAAPSVVAATLAAAKALFVAQRHPDRYVLGADQTLACGNVLLHKPINRADAAAQLAHLSGKTHQLCSAVALARNDQVIVSFVGTAKLTVRQLSAQMIEAYLDGAGEGVTQSVGGYQLEGLGMHLFSRVNGDHTTILGLPMLKTLAHLRKLGLVAQ